jgi:hypothetical protein
VSFKVDFTAGTPSSLGDISLTYEVPPALAPDLSVTSLNTDPASLEVGNETTVSVGVRNEGASCAAAATVRLYANGNQVGYDYVLPDMIIPAGMEETVSFFYACTAAGPVELTAVVDPDGKVDEASEENNTLTTTLEVRPSGIVAAISTDKGSYGPEEDVHITSTVVNDSESVRYLSLETFVEDSAGNYVGYVNYEDIDSLAPGEESTFASTWNSGLNYSGDYRIRVRVNQGTAEMASASAPFAIEPEGSLSLGATCDRIYYSAGDQAGLRARLISEAANFAYDGMTVTGEVLAPDSSTLYSSNENCPTLYPGDLADIPFTYQVGCGSAGVYTFRATVMHQGQAIATSEATFEVKPTSFNGTGITGSLVSTPQLLEQGAPFTLDYTLVNQGNEDISELPVWLVIVDPMTAEAVESRGLSIDLAQSTSVQGEEAFSSADLASAEGGKVYLAVLIASFSDGAKTLGFTTLRVTPPTLDHFELSQMAGQVAGVPFQLEVHAISAYGLDVPYSGTLDFADTTGTLSPDQGEMVDGAFTGTFTITKTTSADTMVLTMEGLSATTNAFEVLPGAADHLTVETVASPQMAGVPFALTAYAWDAYDNPATGFNEACTLSDATGTIAPQGSAFIDGQMSVQVSVTQAHASDVISIDAGGLAGTSNPFEVLTSGPAVDIDMTLGIESQQAVPSVLVWTDTDANEALITEVLVASGYNYTIVRSDHAHGCGHSGHKAGMEDFCREMRSGCYNSYLLLSPDHPLERHLADELRELVNSGAGLLVSDPANIQTFKEHPTKGGVIDLFGVKFKGYLPPGSYIASLTDSALSPSATLAFSGKMKKLEIDDAQVLGTVSVQKGNKTETWPALTLKQYGLGSASLAAFDFAQVATGDRDKAKAILSRAITSLAAPAPAHDAGLPVPLRLDLANLEAEALIKVSIPLPAGVNFLWGEGAALEQGKVVFDLSLAEAEQKQLHMLLLPSQPGGCALSASLSYLDQGSYVFLKEASLTLSVGGGAASLQAEAQAAIDALAVANKDRHYKQKAYEEVSGIDLAEQDPAEVEKDIEDLLKAAEDLQRIGSADTTACRLLTDRLLIQEQIRWYTLTGGGD